MNDNDTLKGPDGSHLIWTCNPDLLYSFMLSN